MGITLQSAGTALVMSKEDFERLCDKVEAINESLVTSDRK